MTYRVRLAAEAIADHTEILDWIAERSPDGALRWLAAFEQMIDSIGLHPFAHSFAPENERRDIQIRNAFFGTPKGRVFRAIYYVEDDVVTVTHLRGPHQKPLSQEEIDNS